MSDVTQISDELSTVLAKYSAGVDLLNFTWSFGGVRGNYGRVYEAVIDAFEWELFETVSRDELMMVMSDEYPADMTDEDFDSLRDEIAMKFWDGVIADTSDSWPAMGPIGGQN